LPDYSFFILQVFLEQLEGIGVQVYGWKETLIDGFEGGD
jgi:hypothetical protein